MKFTNGYWVLKPEYDIHFATQGVRARMDADALEVLGATRPIRGRGDMLDGPVLTVRPGGERDSRAHHAFQGRRTEGTVPGNVRNARAAGD